MTPASCRRAALLGLAILATGCDLIAFVNDPKPILEETWNLPITTSTIRVDDLLPAGGTVTVNAAKTAFLVKIDSTVITRTVGSDCPVCVTLNGQNAPKPQFILNAGNSSSLPAEVSNAQILGGDTLAVRLVNNMSFDPLYVNTVPGATTQGFLKITVRSGSVVLATDSVRGAATVSGTQNSPFAKNGGVLVRNILFTTGTVATNLTVDVTINSPQGDHNEFINSNGTLNASAKISPSLRVGSVTLAVNSKTMNSGSADTLPTMDNKNLVKATLEMTITNPFDSISGNLRVKFKHGPLPGDTISKPITLPTGTDVRTVSLDSMELQTILQNKSVLTVTGTVVGAPGGQVVTPGQTLSISNRLIGTIRTPAGGQ